MIHGITYIVVFLDIYILLLNSIWSTFLYLSFISSSIALYVLWMIVPLYAVRMIKKILYWYINDTWSNLHSGNFRYLNIAFKYHMEHIYISSFYIFYGWGRTCDQSYSYVRAFSLFHFISFDIDRSHLHGFLVDAFDLSKSKINESIFIASLRYFLYW